MPDLIGRYWMDAEPLVRRLGWVGVLDKGPDVPGGGLNRIAMQSPAAGERLARDGVIAVRFGS